MKRVYTCTVDPSKIVYPEVREAITGTWPGASLLYISFHITNWEKVPAEPAAGFLYDTAEVTNVVVTDILLQYKDAKGEVQDESTAEFHTLPEGLQDELIYMCLEECSRNPDWVNIELDHSDEI